jgi:hypothetical protein
MTGSNFITLGQKSIQDLTSGWRRLPLFHRASSWNAILARQEWYMIRL